MTSDKLFNILGVVALFAFFLIAGWLAFFFAGLIYFPRADMTFASANYLVGYLYTALACGVAALLRSEIRWEHTTKGQRVVHSGVVHVFLPVLAGFVWAVCIVDTMVRMNF